MITENYIKMCEKAEEIQEKWRSPFKNYVGDLYWKGKKYLMISEACLFVTEIMFKPEDEHIYLPTQEQLIKMHFDWYLERYKGKMMISEYFLYLSEFAVIAEESKYKYYSPVEMMMGYLYQEKYSKEWTGEKWKEIL